MSKHSRNEHQIRRWNRDRFCVQFEDGNLMHIRNQSNWRKGRHQMFPYKLPKPVARIWCMQGRWGWWYYGSNSPVSGYAIANRRRGFFAVKVFLAR